MDLGQIQVPRGSLDVRNFFYNSTLEKRMDILRRNKVDHVMFPADSPLVESLRQFPGFTPVDTPSERYVLFAVDRGRPPD